jgi:hypothetical protein
VLQMQRRQQQGAAAAASPPPQSPASSSSSSPIPIGTRVELHGLEAKPELNRQRGVVAGFDAGSGRCVVKLEDGHSYKFKVENLKAIATATTTTTKKKKKKKQKKQGGK